MFEVIEDAPFFITVPDLPLLDAAEGFALAASAFKPHFKEIVTGRRKAAILIPEDRPPFTPNLKSRSITEAFFTGMFQEFLTALREEYFPELKFEAAREGLHIVGG
ncbi:MAG: hypothetical protein P4M15_04340, partial [Alphaproteobacteria bacterium]|nr:hypothetical protein [Alphaproteobacteria bacterium]